MDQKWSALLAQSALFQGMSDDELKTLLECLKPKVAGFKKNEFITMAGGQFTGIGILMAGEAVVTNENAAGNRIIMALLKPGEMFGEMAAFSGNGVWPATVVAQESSTVLFLPPEKIVGGCANLCANHRTLTTNMLRLLSEKALALTRKVEYLAGKSLRGKIGHFLLEQYQNSRRTTFTIPLNRNELADFLNVTRPALSREMGRLRDEGMIEFHRSAVRIKDLKGLQRLVQT